MLPGSVTAGSVTAGSVTARSVRAVLRAPQQQLSLTFAKMSSGPVLPQGKSGKGWSKGGRTTWKVGEKLWNNAVIHKSSEFLKKYPSKPTVNDEGMSSAAWEGLGSPQTWVHADTLGEALSAGNTELINRVVIGFSEFASVLENQILLIREGGDKKILHPELVKKYIQLHEQFHLDEAAKVLNPHAYPNLQRSEQHLISSVSNVLKFSQEIRKDWSFWSEVFGRASALTVNMSWQLSVAALTSGTAYAGKLTDVPTKVPDKKAALIANPTSGVAMKNFIVAELAAANGIKESASSSGGQSGFRALNFDDDEVFQAPPQEELPATAQLRRVRKVCADLLAMQFPAGKSADTWPGKGKVKKFAQALRTLPDTLNDELAALCALDATLPEEEQQAVVNHVKSLKRKVREYEQA